MRWTRLACAALALVLLLETRSGAAAEEELTKEQLEALWEDLLDDEAANAHRSHRAQKVLIRAPKQALELLGPRLKACAAPDAQHIEKLIADLDSPQFQVRQKATQELEQYGDLVLAAIKKALDGKPSLEVRQRLEQIRSKVDDARPRGERLRTCRALEVLEKIGTPEAQHILKRIADGAPGSLVTEDAQEALERVTKKLASKGMS